MITCERCQTENIDGSQYCDECGANLPGTSSGKKYTSDDGGAAAAGGAHSAVVASETRAAGEGGVSGAQAAAGTVEPVEQPRAERRREPAEVIPLRQSQAVSPARTSVV